MGIEIPEEYGGAGSNFFSSIIAIEELAKVDSSMGGLVDLQNTVVNTLLMHNASKEHLAQYCPKLATHMVYIFYFKSLMLVLSVFVLLFQINQIKLFSYNE